MHGNTLLSSCALVLLFASPLAGAAEPDAIKRTGATPPTPYSLTVEVPANAQYTFVAGTVADVANPDAPKDSVEAYGNTATQTTSVLKKIAALLAREGLSMGDVVKANVYLVGDPKLDNKMDFAGLNAAYGQFFGSATQPNKPVRTTVAVSGLPKPGTMVEIDVVVARLPAK